MLSLFALMVVQLSADRLLERPVGPLIAAPSAGQAPVRLKAEIRDEDYPDALARQGISGEVRVKYLVGVDGRVHRCDIVQTSGFAQLDALTCRLVMRFRFRPAKDAHGVDIAAYVVENHTWTIGHRPK